MTKQPSTVSAHIKGNTKSRAARDMFAVHREQCKDCAELVTPLLHVTCYSSSAGAGANVNTESSNGSNGSGPLEALLVQHDAVTVTTVRHTAPSCGAPCGSARVSICPPAWCIQVTPAPTIAPPIARTTALTTIA